MLSFFFVSHDAERGRWERHKNEWKMMIYLNQFCVVFPSTFEEIQQQRDE